jgi:hypothetical protein
MIVGIAGLPGSGKSRLILDYQAKGYIVFDDINSNKKGGWILSVVHARSLSAGGSNVVVSDIMFCEPGWRQRLEEDLGVPVHWVCFENVPERCARNCRYRAGLDPSHILGFELGMIDRLSPQYQPVGEILPVVDAEQAGAPHLVNSVRPT